MNTWRFLMDPGSMLGINKKHSFHSSHTSSSQPQAPTLARCAARKAKSPLWPVVPWKLSWDWHQKTKVSGPSGWWKYIRILLNTCIYIYTYYVNVYVKWKYVYILLLGNRLNNFLLAMNTGYIRFTEQDQNSRLWNHTQLRETSHVWKKITSIYRFSGYQPLTAM